MKLKIYLFLFLLILSSFSVLAGDLVQTKETSTFTDDKGSLSFKVLGMDDKDNDKYALSFVQNDLSAIQFGFDFDVKTTDAKILISSTETLIQIDSLRLGYEIDNSGLYQIIDFNDLQRKNPNGIIEIVLIDKNYYLIAKNIDDWDPIIYRNFITNLGGGAGLYQNTTTLTKFNGVALMNISILGFNISSNSTKGLGYDQYNITGLINGQQPTYIANAGLQGKGVWRFDGVNDNMRIPFKTSNDTAAYASTMNYAFLMVLNISTGANTRFFAHRAAGNTGLDMGVNLNRIRWITSDAGANELYAGSNVADNLTHTYAFIYQTSNATKYIYIDGVLANSTAQTAVFAVASVNTTLGSTSLQSAYWAGDIEHVQVLRKYMSAGDVLDWNSTLRYIGFEDNGYYAVPFNNSNNHTIWKNVSINCRTYNYTGDTGSACGNTLIVNVSYSNVYPTTSFSEIATFYQQNGDIAVYNISPNDEYFFSNVSVSNLSIKQPSDFKLLKNITVGYEDNRKNLYVGVGGSDYNPGTLFRPYATISKAQNVSIDKDIINIGSGAFTEVAWSSSAMLFSNGVTVRGNGTSSTVIRMQSAAINYGFFINDDNTTIANLTIDGNSQRLNVGSDGVFSCILVNSNKNNTLISGVRLENCTTSLELGAGKLQNLTVTNSSFWNNTGTNVFDLGTGGQQDLNFSYNRFDLSGVAGQLGIAEDTGGQGAIFNGTGLYIGYNNFTTYLGNGSYSTAIYLDSNYTRGFQGAQIDNNNFGSSIRGYDGLAIRFREMNALNFTHNNIFLNNSAGRNVIHIEATNENISISNNNFCVGGIPCNNTGGGAIIRSESSSYLTIENNTGIFSDVGEVFWAYSDYGNTTNIKMSNNRINLTLRPSTAHILGIGEEGTSSNETYYGQLTNNTIVMPTTSTASEHSIFMGYCWYCNASFNTVIGGAYGLAMKGNREGNFWNNTLINQSLLNVYDKWGNYSIYENNTVISQINGINVVQISTSGGNSTYINFTRNKINVSLTDNTTTGLFQDSTSDNLYSNFNIWHFPYYEFNQSFKNGSTFMNWTVWNVTNQEDMNSTFLPLSGGAPPPPPDTTPPQVFNLTPANSTSYQALTIVNISANITDNSSISLVYINITYPNTSKFQYTPTPYIGNNFRFNFSSPNLPGLYNVSWYAADSAGNINATETSNFTLAAIPIIPFVEPLYAPCSILETANQNCTVFAAINGTGLPGCGQFNFTLYNQTDLNQTGNMTYYVNTSQNNIYYFTFNKNIGDYTIHFCDGSTKDIKVQEDLEMLIAIMILYSVIICAFLALAFIFENELRAVFIILSMATIVAALGMATTFTDAYPGIKQIVTGNYTAFLWFLAFLMAWILIKAIFEYRKRDKVTTKK